MPTKSLLAFLQLVRLWYTIFKSGDNYISDADTLTQMHMKSMGVYSIDYNGPLQFDDTRTLVKLQPKINGLCTGFIRQIFTTPKGFSSRATNEPSNEKTKKSTLAADLDLNWTVIKISTCYVCSNTLFLWLLDFLYPFFRRKISYRFRKLSKEKSFFFSSFFLYFWKFTINIFISNFLKKVH